MAETDFFKEIEHTPIPWRKYTLHAPLFYRDFMFISVSMLTPIKNLKKILPSERLKPYRILPGQGILTVTGYKYADTDIGPYNEISIAVPVTIDKPTPLFTGILYKMPEILMPYIVHLPVTTEAAREIGAEFAGYPKFVADIEFSDKSDWLEFSLNEGSRNILSLGGRKLKTVYSPRLRLDPLTFRNGYMLRSELIMSGREIGQSKKKGEVSFVLGNHSISDEIKALNPGKIIGYNFCPQTQAVLTPVIESFPSAAPCPR